MAPPDPDQSQFENVTSLRHVIINPTATLSVSLFVYGLYVMIFGRAMYLFPRKAQSCHVLHRAGIIALFILVTFGVVLNTVVATRESVIVFTTIKTGDFALLEDYGQNDRVIKFSNPSMNFLSVITNFVADSMLIHRCYAIWDYRKRVGIPLIFAALCTTALGTASVIVMAVAIADTSKEANHQLYMNSHIIFAGYAFFNVVVNLCITLTTGGRIWWTFNVIQKMVEPGLGQEPWQGYKKVVAIILESGAIYPATVLVYSTIDHTVVPRGTEVAAINLLPLVLLAAGIAPTLIIVRAKSLNTDKSSRHR